MATRTRQRIDINAANAEQIEKACGIDGVLAERIIAYRDEHGPFESREDLEAVPGFADVRTDEVLSVVDLPARRGSSKRSAARSSTKRQETRDGGHASTERARSSRSGSTASRRSTSSDSKSSGTSSSRSRSRS